MDRAGTMRAAMELFQSRNFPGVVAACTEAVNDEPDSHHLRLLLAKALLALRRDTEAQHQISEYMQRRPQCPDAYHLLGKLALRRDELKSSEIFFKESLRLEPGNREVAELLTIVLCMLQPIVAGEKLPAAPVTVGCTFSNESRGRRPRRFPQGTVSDD